MSDSEADLVALMRADRMVQNKRRAEQAAVRACPELSTSRGVVRLSAIARCGRLRPRHGAP
jgi:hypothetical protein